MVYLKVKCSIFILYNTVKCAETVSEVTVRTDLNQVFIQRSLQ